MPEVAAPPRTALVVAGLLLVAVALVELLVVVSLSRRDSGANIGLPLAILGVVLALAVARISWWAARAPCGSAGAVSRRAIAVAWQVLTALLLLFLAQGIAEEL